MTLIQYAYDIHFFCLLLSSLNVAMANFLDTIIDYPNSKIYAEQLIQRMEEIKVLTASQVKNYSMHIDHVEKQSQEVDSDI